MNILLQRSIESVIAVPSLTTCLEVGFLLFIYTSIVLPIGFRTKFLHWNLLRSHQIIIKILLTSLFTPAILEEIFFRVLLLPHPTEKTSIVTLSFWTLISLILFVIYHPINAITFFPAGRKTFFEPVFLGCAALLGLICTIAYENSGSLWLAAFIHWLVVIIWLIFLGGYDRLRSSQSHYPE